MTDSTGQEQLKESISALMDGQASEMELRRIMKAGETSDEIRSTWSRYHAVSQTIQGDVPAGLSIDLSDAVREAIDAEEQPKNSWLSNVTRMAVAASVAGIVVMTAQFAGQQQDAASTVLTAEAPAANAVSPATLSLPAGFQAPSVAARTVSSESRSGYAPVERNNPFPANAQVLLKSPAAAPSKEVQQHIQEIMSLHATQSALNSNRGMLPYARVPAPAQDVQR